MTTAPQATGLVALADRIELWPIEHLRPYERNPRTHSKAQVIDLAAGGTPVDLEFAYTLSAQAKLVLTAHEVYLPKPKLAVEGPGGVQASFDFRGAKNDAAGRMLTVTLTNDLDGSVYA
jgi:hypothetical protein